MKTPRYDRHSTNDQVDAILQEIATLNDPSACGKDSGKHTITVNRTKVNARSLRLKTFAKYGPVCALCGLKGMFFALERNFAVKAKDGPFHINLYGMNGDGEEILFTHDHKIPKSKGGKNNLSNTQTACHPCNQKKGNKC